MAMNISVISSAGHPPPFIAGRRVCLFALFDPRNSETGAVPVLGITRHYIAAIQHAGFDVHVAMSGMTHLHHTDAAWFAERRIATHFRENSGHDFGAWQALVAAGCASDAETILLANDSVFGPLFDMAPMIETMLARNLDVWGMIESHECAWHLQSWFLCFSAAAFRSPAIERVLRQPFADMTRDEIVLHGELGLGAAIRAARLSWDALWRQPRNRLRRLIPGNAMHLDYLSVVRSGKVPFLKAELLRDNPTRIGWKDDWRKLLKRHPAFPAGLVAEALRQRPPSPRLRARAIMRGLHGLISRDQPEAMLAVFRR